MEWNQTGVRIEFEDWNSTVYPKISPTSLKFFIKFPFSLIKTFRNNASTWQNSVSFFYAYREQQHEWNKSKRKEPSYEKTANKDGEREKSEMRNERKKAPKVN